MALALIGPTLKDQSNHQGSMKDAIAEFQSLLSADERRTLTSIHAAHNSGTVLEFVADLDFKNRLKGGRGVAQRLYGVLESVLAFSGIVDTFVSSNPEIAALVWGSVKMALQIAVNYTSYFEKLTEVFMGIRKLCPRLSDYRALFPDSARLQRALCEFHAAIIRFCTQALRVLKRSRMAHLLNAFQSFEAEFKPHTDKLRELSIDVREEAFLAMAQSDLQAQEIRKKESEIATEQRWKLARTFSRTGREVEDIRRLQEEQRLRESRMENERFLQALSPVDLGAFHEACRKQHPGTTTWIQAMPAFIQWYSGTSPSPLWCCGKIGSGKTIMSVINYILRNKCASDRMAFFFIQYDDTDSIKADTVIRSVLRQCIDDATLYEEEKSTLREMLNGHFIGIEKWIKFIQQRTKTFDKFYLIIDGLDECKADERHILVEALSFLVDHHPKLRLFLAGRPSVRLDLEKKFPSLGQIMMLSDGQAQDIKLYIQTVVEYRLSTGELAIHDAALLDGIVQTLSDHADGMFIWVFFLINEICAASNDDEVRQFLTDLPPDLTATFTRALSRIASRQKKGPLVQKIFTWVVSARRPLSMPELQDILSIDVDDEFSSPGKRVRDLSPIELWSENLLQVNEQDVMSVQFAHSTVREFVTTARLPADLDAFHVDVGDADHFCGELCVTYLNLSDFKTTVSRRPQPLPAMDPIMIAHTALRPSSKTARTLKRLTHRRSASTPLIDVTGQLATYNRQAEHQDDNVLGHDHPFLRYASSNWVFHTNSFAKDKSKTFNKWSVLVEGKHGLAPVPWHPSGSISKLVLWAYAARHVALLRYTVGAHHLTMGLMLSSARDGDLGGVECSLEARFFPPSTIEKAFEAACEGGHVHVVEGLLDSGVCSVAIRLYGPRLLGIAARHGHLRMVQYLIHGGADARATLDSDGCTVLHEAAKGGQWAILKELIDAGANIHAGSDTDSSKELMGSSEDQIRKSVLKDPRHWQPFKKNTVAGVAVDHDYPDLVESVVYYLQDGALCPWWHTCLSDSLSDGLYKASCKGFTNIVNILLNFYSHLHWDLNAEGSGAFFVAVSKGHVDVVEALVDRGFDVNTFDVPFGRNNRSTALIIAAQWGHLSTVKLLLSRKADMLVPDEIGQTALIVASQEGRLEVADHLIKEGAPVDATDFNGETALTVAAQQGCFDICLSLLHGGADINAANKEGRTALLAAARDGHLDVVRHLLDAGADTEWSDVNRQTALEAAAQEGHLAVVKLFFEPVARISARSRQVVLAMSAGHDHQDILQYLLAIRKDRNH